MLTQNETDHVFNQLVNGLVPERGLEALAVGIEKPRAELKRQLDIVQTGGGSVKFLRGGYGCGKTFMARLAITDAQQDKFATSFVVVSDNDLRFHQKIIVTGLCMYKRSDRQCCGAVSYFEPAPSSEDADSSSSSIDRHPILCCKKSYENFHFLLFWDLLH